VIDGLESDVVTLNQVTDLDALMEAKLVIKECRRPKSHLDLPSYRTISQLNYGKSRAFGVSNCIHAAHHINQPIESFPFKETRGDRTAVSAPADNCQRSIFG
jgi:hypothetical protein